MQRLPDHGEHTLRFAKDLDIREAKLAHASLSDETAPSSVVLLLRLGPMLAAVDLDRKSNSSTEEVEDIWPKRVLPTKLETCEALVSHEHPHEPLGVGRVTPESTREVEEPRVHGLNMSHARSSARAAPCCRALP
jgi:hypothetical protein